jgi:MFS family permease
LAAIGLLAASFYFWTSTSNSPLPRQPGPQQDYYNMLVRGMRAGHLYMDAVPDPALLALPADQRPGNAPYLLDASLCGDHYYLYFGVTPAVTVFLPYAVLTGRELPVELAVAAQATAACWVALLLLLRLRREFFPQASGAALVIAGLAVAFATAVPVTLRKSEVYEAACTAGLLWSMALMWFMTLAVLRPSRRGFWLAWASLSLGLAVGSRPNLVVGAGALGGVALWLAWRAEGGLRSVGWRWLMAAMVPAGICGAALAIYNYARFGDPLEIGHRFQVGSIADNYVSLGYLPHNFTVYYLTPPAFSWFFPFFSPGHAGARPLHYMGIEYANGQWFMVPLAVGALALGALFWRRWKAREQLVVIVAAVGFWFLANFALVGSLSARANRYMLDFHPALVLLVCLALLAASGRRGWWRPAVVVGSSGLIVAVVFNVAVSFQVHEFFQQKNSGAFAAIERVANRIVWPFHRRLAPPFGPLEAEVVFAATPRWAGASRCDDGRSPIGQRSDHGDGRARAGLAGIRP